MGSSRRELRIRQQHADDVRLSAAVSQADLNSRNDLFQAELSRKTTTTPSPLHDISYIGSSSSVAWSAPGSRHDLAKDFGNGKDASMASRVAHSPLRWPVRTEENKEDASISQFAAQLSRFKFGLDRPL